MSDDAAAPRKTSEARDRLVRVASGLFYREGINSVGMDRVLAEASVTRATMYRHFSGKEALVAAYLDREDELLRQQFAAAAATVPSPTPAQLVHLVIEGIADDIERHHTRGCPFINAAAEFPDASSPVRLIVARHRAWFRAALHDVLDAAGHPHPTATAASLVLLRDAALVGGYLDGVEVARPAVLAAAQAVLRAA
ncbi:TetR/AcrR family transcriptional regulator [Herbiconiux sp. 11R-BC]|uniref:TetR/AcrR family transcriptional regulator n=1 Tax=Herbiconiux sp. 11R-BC TaxID=3111637 RepID=UPI003C0CA661